MAGRGGTTGGGGAGGTATCVPPSSRPVSIGQLQPGNTWTCGYNDPLGNSSHITTITGGAVAVVVVDSATFGNTAACGQCLRIVRQRPGVPDRTVEVTIAGRCPGNQPCSTTAPDPLFRLNTAAYAVLADPVMDVALPAPGDTVTATDIPCPVANNLIYAYVNGANNTLNGARFAGQRYGLMTVRVQGMDFVRRSDNLWLPPMDFGAPPWRFDIVDINGHVVTTGPLINSLTADPDQSTMVQNPACQ
jgi:hypothetical protein